MTTDWAQVAIVVLPAVAAGGAAVWATSLSSRVELRKVEAEADRLRDQHREDHLRHRQGLYHDFLKIDRLVRDHPETDIEEARKLRLAWQDAQSGVVLFGTQDVREAMRGYQAVRELPSQDPNTIAARRLLVDAMREDIAPGSTIDVG